MLIRSVTSWGAAGDSTRPNIILCMSDDQGWGDTGYNGHPRLETPSLDAIARDGITFTRFYSAAAMCSPTRGSVYTGRHPYRFGITFAMKGRLESSEIALTSVLKQHGYTTGHFGKWHLGTLTQIKGDQKRWGAFSKDPVRYHCPPWHRDVDVSFVTESKVPTWNPMQTPPPVKKQPAEGAAGLPAAMTPYGNEYFIGENKKATENLEGDDSKVIMDRVLPFIRSAHESNTPFLSVIWFHTPHSPVVAGPSYRGRYADCDENEQHYYGCITAMDEQIGRLRQELDDLEIAEDTLFFFCSDNGPARQGSPRHVGSNGGLTGYKLSLNEGGIRVPGLMVWPGRIQPGRTIDAPCVTTDYFPTILDALDIPLPTDRTYDGESLLPLVSGRASARRRPIGFLNKEGKEAAWIAGDYKLLHTAKKTQLYNLADDPAEKHDLSVRMPKLTAALTAELTEWKAGVMADLETTLSFTDLPGQ